MIVMGSAAVTDGFALLGFETWPDATEEQLEDVLNELVRNAKRAVIFLEPYLARCNCSVLKVLRNEGGRVVITEIPALHAPGDYHPEVEDLVLSVLGPDALEERA